MVFTLALPGARAGEALAARSAGRAAAVVRAGAFAGVLAVVRVVTLAPAAAFALAVRACDVRCCVRACLLAVFTACPVVALATGFGFESVLAEVRALRGSAARAAAFFGLRVARATDFFAGLEFTWRTPSR